MFKKLNITTLLIILVIVAAIYVIIKFTGQDERNFRSQLTSYEEERVTKIEYIKQGDKDKKVTIEKQDGQWKVVQADQTYNADSNRVRRMVTMMKDLKVDRVAAKDKAQWEEYEVNDSLSTRVKYYDNGDLLTDLYIGKFSMSQPDNQQQMRRRRNARRNMTTFVRLAHERPVYAVNGFLSRAFPGDAGKLRDRTLVNATKGNINGVDFAGKYNYTLSRSSGKWMIKDRPADSAKAAGYMGTLAGLRGNQFADISNKSELSQPLQTGVIDRTGKDPVTIKAYNAPETKSYDYIIHSSQNDEVWFTSSNRLFEKIFKEPDYFRQVD
ncbi:MAG: DUF4340 domain-containing protein [Bacteroidales bacterium]|nr:DUF4340 domain-containing protein [Bacteroidales bacterium]MCF8338494.1 DUF4340 domain-containing protein [Bacteroidales bacterium]